jgi:3-dehydroquinate synthase
MLDAMAVLLQTISVPFEYPVYFTRDLFAVENRDLLDAVTRREPTRRHRLLVVIDDGVAAAWRDLTAAVARYVERWADRLVLAADPMVIAGGEAVKNDPAVLGALHARLHALGIDRQSVVLVVGGGAVLDMVGYAAATTHRGVRVVRVPTTVLAQSDSGVSVKNGVNGFGSKNFLGTFAPPFAVLNDADFLATLAPRDVVAGLAEGVKVALVRDADFFEWHERHADALAACDLKTVAEQIARSARLHLAHIAGSGDPFEMGSARPLDFGHWAAHKLEMMSDHRLRHGEAVAIGMALDSSYAADVGMLAESACERILMVLRRLGLPIFDVALRACGPDERPRVLDGLAEFREHLGGELTITLLGDLGRGLEVHEMHEQSVLRAIDRLARLDTAR